MVTAGMKASCTVQQAASYYRTRCLSRIWYLIDNLNRDQRNDYPGECHAVGPRQVSDAACDQGAGQDCDPPRPHLARARDR